jgi:hypothetical protein
MPAKTLEQKELYKLNKRLKYRANPEKHREKAKIWRSNNVEKDKENQKRRYWKNPEYYRQQAKERALRNPDGIKNAWLLRYYKITLAEYRNLQEIQQGLCAICLNPEQSRHQNGVLRELAVDHNHTTNEVRGLLCSNCNLAIGKFKDDTSLLAKAIEYLQKHEHRTNIENTQQ